MIRRQSDLACSVLKVAFGQNKIVIPSPDLMNRYQQSCNANDNAACAIVGVLQAAGSNPMAKSNLSRACNMGDKWACEIQKNVK